MSSINRNKLILAVALLDDLEQSFERNRRMWTLTLHVLKNARLRNRHSVIAANIYYAVDERPDELYSEHWIERYMDIDFFRLFRMMKQTFTSLSHILVEKGGLETVWTQGKEPVTPHKMLQIALRYYCSQESIKEIGNAFNVADSTVFTIRTKCTAALLIVLPTIIKWPTHDAMSMVQEDFQKIAGFPGVLGAIDGSHIPVVSKNLSESYLNRHLSHSIVLQGICAANKLFTDIATGYPGRIDDSRILRVSPIGEAIEVQGMEKYFPSNTHLLGDSAYETKQWLLPPYNASERMDELRTHFNKVHSKTRAAIGHTFALLKKRWQRLTMVNVSTPAKAADIVAACCVLHNFCLLQEDLFDIGGECEDEVEDNLNHLHVDSQYKDVNGLSKRNDIADYLFRI